MKRWTKEEDALIAALRAEGFNYREIAARVKRTPEATRVRLSKVATKSRNWTDEERELVYKLKAQNFTAAYIAKVLDRTTRAVQSFLAREWTNLCLIYKDHTWEK